jgi:hypothetical protein
MHHLAEARIARATDWVIEKHQSRSIARQQARISMLKDGDANTTFFTSNASSVSRKTESTASPLSTPDH